MPDPTPKTFRDRLGNLWDEDDHLIEKTPVKEPIDIYHFYCIACKDVRSFEFGFCAGHQLGGWMCLSHILPG